MTNDDVKLERQLNEIMREHSTNMRRLVELLFIPPAVPYPRGDLAASEQSIRRNNEGLILIGGNFKRVAGASEVIVRAGSAATGTELADILIAVADTVQTHEWIVPTGIDIEEGVFTQVVAGTMHVVYYVTRRAVAVNKSI